MKVVTALRYMQIFKEWLYKPISLTPNQLVIVYDTLDDCKSSFHKFILSYYPPV